MKAWRFWTIFSVFLLCFLAIGARLVQLQWKPDPRLERLAENKGRWAEKKEAESLLKSRGGILDRNGRKLAISLISQSFFANPRLIENPKSVALKLSPHLKVPSAKLQELLSQDRFFVWLQREVDEERARRVLSLEIPGIHTSKESKRLYPQKGIAKNIIGIAGRDGKGLEGIERRYDSWLQASDQASELGLRDALGRLLLFKDFERQWFEGHDVVLTIDLQLQKLVEEELQRTVEKNKALSGQAILMDPRTGAILAMGSVDGKGADEQIYRNRPVVDMYEPGSTFKILTALGALEKLHMTRTSQIYGEEGVLRVGPQTVREFNRKKYAWLSLEEMLTHSSNVASAKIGLQLGAQNFHSLLERFELGQPTQIDFPGEAKGILRSPQSWRPIDLANIAFGQGIATTPLQMARVYSAFANGGYLVTPHFVQRIQSIEEEPRIVWEVELKKKEVLDAHFARVMTDMLVAVTSEGGTGQNAAIEGFEVAGKTGTSQKVVEQEINGKIQRTYSRDQSIASFIGYVPAHDPAFVLLVMYDSAEGISSGGFTAAPSFRRIASRALGLMGVSRSVPMASKTGAKSASQDFVGRDFREVLSEIRTWDMEKQAQVELYGIGKAVREEREGDQIRVFFED